MIRFGCPTCQQTLELANELGGTKIRCTRCNQRLRVPTADDLDRTVPGRLLMGTIANHTTGLAPGEAAPAARKTPAPTPAPPAASPAASPAPPDKAPQSGSPPKEPLWFYVTHGKRHGPVSGSQLGQLLSGARIQATDMVWTEGMAKWEPVRAVAHRLSPATTEQVRSGSLPPGLKPPTTAAAPRTPSPAARVPLGLVAGSLGALTLVVSTTVGIVYLVANRPEGSTETTAAGTTGPVNQTQLPLAELTTRSKPSLARIHLPKATTTGFLINREYVVTSWQPLSDAPAASLQVSFPSGPTITQTPARADLVYVNPRRDLAILRLNTTAASLPLAENATLTPGEPIALAGYAEAQGESSTLAAIVGGATTQDNLTWSALQATIPTAYVGGPLLNAQGEVIGVTVEHKKTMRVLPLADLRKGIEQAQVATTADQATRNARHDATLVFRRLQRSGTVHFEILDRVERSMQEAVKNKLKPDPAYEQELLASERQRKELHAPILESEAVRVQLVENPHLPVTIRQPLVEFRETYDKIRALLQSFRVEYADVAVFARQTQELNREFQRLRNQLQSQLDLPPLD